MAPFDVNITSSTDTPEQVRAALTEEPIKPGDYAPKPKIEEPSAAKVEEPDDDEEITPAEEAKLGEEAAATSAAKPSKAKQRIGRLVFEKHRLAEENRVLRETLAAKGDTEPKSAIKPEEPQEAIFAFAKAKPSIDDFDTIEEWTDALTDWKADKRDHDREQKDLAERRRVEGTQRTREQDTLRARHIERIAEFRKTHDDFDTVAQQAIADEVPTSPIMDQHFMHSDMGPDLLYYLGTHQEECRKIAALPSGPALVALGRIEAKLELAKGAPAESGKGGKSAATPVASKAEDRRGPSAPIRPVGGGRAQASMKKPEDMTQEEFNKWRAEGGGS